MENTEPKHNIIIDIDPDLYSVEELSKLTDLLYEMGLYSEAQDIEEYILIKKAEDDYAQEEIKG